MSRPTLLTWLRSQRLRADDVGTLARELAGDTCLTARKVAGIAAHREQVHGASIEELDTLARAAGEHEITTRGRR